MRQGYILRLALGRSADLPPDWQALEDLQLYRQSTETPHRSANGTTSPYYIYSGPPHLMHQQCYNVRGRPFNFASRIFDSEHVGAQNEVQTIAVEHMSGPEHETSDRLSRDLMKKHHQLVDSEQNLRTALTEFCMEIRELSIHWLATANARWGMRGLRLSFTESLRADLKREGAVRLFTGGLLTTYLHAHVFASIDTWTNRAVDIIKDKAFPSFNQYIRGATLVKIIRLGAEIGFLAPLRIWAQLHCLFLLPAEPLLPPAQYWNPLSRWSPFQPLALNRSVLWHPILWELSFDHLFPLMHRAYTSACDRMDEFARELVNDLDGEKEEMAALIHSQSLSDQPDGATSSSAEAAAYLRMSTMWKVQMAIAIPFRRAVGCLSRWFRQPSRWEPLDENRLSPLHNVPVEAANLVWRELFYDAFTFCFYLMDDRFSARNFVLGNMAPALRDDAVVRGVLIPDIPTIQGVLTWRWQDQAFVAKQILLTLAVKTAIGVAWTGMQVLIVRHYSRQRNEATKTSLRFFKKHRYGL